MIANRSVPTDTLIPHVFYQDLTAAIAWLTRVFGFTEHFRYGEPSGAQMHLGNAYVMVATSRGGSSPAQIGHGTQYLTIFIEDVEAHYAHTKSEGAKIIEEPHETVYGEFQYAAEDLDGHRWLFSRHAKDLSPTDWGATLATP
jgi:uncharacterized glyoxalase superfamily protein PhnB